MKKLIWFSVLRLVAIVECPSSALNIVNLNCNQNAIKESFRIRPFRKFQAKNARFNAITHCSEVSH